MKKAEKAKLKSYLSEVEEIQSEESIYFKLDSGRTEVVQFKSYERLDKEVDWGDGITIEDTFRLNLINNDGEEKVFDRKFGHNFSKSILPLLINGSLKPDQMAEMKKAAGRFGEYMLIPIVEDTEEEADISPTDAELED